MKKTQFVDAIKNIRKRFASFLSITLVIAIGTGGFFTTQNIYRSLKETFDGYYADQNFRDLDLVSSGGIVDEDVETVSRLEEVESAEAVMEISGELIRDKDRYNIQIMSLTRTVSVPELVEGTLPSRQGEVAVNEDLAKDANIKINDTVTIRNTSSLYGDPLKEETYRVSAIIRHPDYLRNGMTYGVVLPLDSFNMAATGDSYTNLFVKLKDTSYNQVSALLPELGRNTTMRIRNNADSLIEQRTSEIKKQLQEAEDRIGEEEKAANEKLQDAEKQIVEFESLFADGQTQIEEGRATLAQALARLKDGEKQIRDGERQLNQAKEAYDTISSILKPISQKTGIPLNGQTMLQYVNLLKSAITAFQQALEEGNEEMIIQAVDILFGVLDDDKIYELIDQMSDMDELFDSENIIDTIEEKRAFIDEILNEGSETAMAFLDYFTSEGLDRYLDTLLGYLDELADALEEGSEAAIEQAKQAIADFFDEKGSVIVDTLLYRYTGYTLEDIYIKLENVQLLEPYVDRMDTIISLVGANPEFCDMFAKSALTYFINTSLKGYMNDYLQAMIGGNQETIDSTRAALEAFLAQQSTKDTIHLIELITGEELQSRIDDVMENTTEESLSDLISYTTQTVAIYVNDYYPESLTPSSVLPALQSVSEILHQALDLSNNFTMDNYDALRDALDILLEDETICLIMQMIDYKYGFNFFEIAGNIQDGTYIEIVRYQARLYIELLKNSSDFINELGKAAIVQMLERYDDALNQLEDKIREKDLRSAFETFKFIVTMLSQDDFSLLRQLIINYFDRTIVIDFSQIIPPDKLDALLEKLDELADVIRQFRDLEKRISDGEKRLEQGKNELAAGYATYYEGLALLEEKEKLLNSSAFQIRDARRQLEEKRQEAYSALQKAKDELASARKEADEAIEKGREELLNRSCNWVIQDRESNASYIDSRGPINGAYGSSKSFGALFLMVISLVCFSTIAIIVEEEKKSVGTTKAFGFYNREILAKYLIFGVTAAVIGSLLGVVLGLVICRIVLNVFASGEIYAVGGYTMKTSPLSMILVPLFITAMSAFTVYFACTDLLKTPAALLMKGETVSSRDRKEKKKKTTVRSNRSLYSRLILRNIINEKERVAVTVIIVAISCFCIGTGVTLKDAFTGMIRKQKEDIYLYDFRIDYTADTTGDELGRIESILDQNDADYLKASYNIRLFDRGQKADGIYIIAGDPNKLGEYIAIKDPKTKKDVALPEEGVLAQLRLSESFGADPGTTLTIYDDQLLKHDAEVKGLFQNYQGRLLLASKKAYAKIFDEEAEDNCYFVKLNRDNYDSLYRELTDVGNISIDRADSYKARFTSTISLFNIIIVLMIMMSVLMSFMILTNLANIFIARKKKELIVMRINGFSIRQTITYLARETILTSLLGVVLAILLGVAFEKFVISLLEQPDAQFVRTFNVKAWIIAVTLELLFSFIVNYTVFQKVKKLNFKEIQ